MTVDKVQYAAQMQRSSIPSTYLHGDEAQSKCLTSLQDMGMVAAITTQLISAVHIYCYFKVLASNYKEKVGGMGGLYITNLKSVYGSFLDFAYRAITAHMFLRCPYRASHLCLTQNHSHILTRTQRECTMHVSSIGFSGA